MAEAAEAEPKTEAQAVKAVDEEAKPDEAKPEDAQPEEAKVDDANKEEAKPADDEKKEEENADDGQEKMRGNWLALESNPGPLNKFATRMGLPGDYAFCDIYGLDAELLQFVPQPVLAVMLLFPSSVKIKEFKAKQMDELTKSPQKMNDDLFYLYQHDEFRLFLSSP